MKIFLRDYEEDLLRDYEEDLLRDYVEDFLRDYVEDFLRRILIPYLFLRFIIYFLSDLMTPSLMRRGWVLIGVIEKPSFYRRYSKNPTCVHIEIIFLIFSDFSSCTTF
jgi:hypothetical protein